MADYHVVVTMPGTMEQLTRTASGPLTIGRSDTCDIFLNYPTISRPHAEIDCDDAGRFTVRDLASHNGTSVNGRVLHDESAVVRGPATLNIGPCVITLLPAGTTEDTVTASIALEDEAPRLRLDRGRRALLFGERVVIERLSNLEFRLMDYLDASAPNVVTNTQLGDGLWGEGQWDVYMLHNMIRRIRRKLEAQEMAADEHLLTVPGVGYRLA